MQKKVRSETSLSQKHVSVEMINAKLFEARLYLRPTFAKACALHDLCSTGQIAQCSCTVTMPSSRLVLGIELDDKRNQSRNTFRKAFAYAF